MFVAILEVNCGIVKYFCETNAEQIKKKICTILIVFIIFCFFASIYFVQHNNAVSIGISSLSSCGDPEKLPELPPGDEQRLQRAALHLQQKLILREWLKEHRLQHHYSRYIH